MKNSKNPGIINHEGVVQKKNDKSVTVSITTVTACSGCHAEDLCSQSGKAEKIIEVTGNFNVKPGDPVTILMKQSMGYAALLLGYILPLIAVLAILVIMNSLKIPELFGGLTSIAILIPYYIILFLFRKRVNDKFAFTLKT
jgi:sigma-E factor negative regulatory protein RseC